MSASTSLNRVSAAGTLIALGIVYGDIGTSPLYTVRGVFVSRPVTEDVVLGTISCILWTLTLLTTVKYVLIALKADNNGEGGILALFARLRRLILLLPCAATARSGEGGAQAYQRQPRVREHSRSL